MTIVVQHLQASSSLKRRQFVAKLSYCIFPRQGSTGAQVKWVLKDPITRVTVWGHKHFLNNLRLAMVKESLGVGPKYYCIIRSTAENFAQKVFLMTRYLPHQKFTIRPYGPPLEGPFLRPERRLMGQAMCNRRTPQGDIPPFCPRCYAWWCRDGRCRGLPQLERSDD